MFELAWPIIVIELLQVARNPADTVWLGRLSTGAVTAISLVFPFIFLFISVGGGSTAVGNTLVVQHTGTKSEGSAETVIGQMLTSIIVITVVVGAIGFFATDAMLGILPGSKAAAGQVIPLAGSYMRVLSLDLPFPFSFFVFSALVHGYGNVRAPMVVIFISVIINIIVDPMFIFSFDANPLFSMFGVEGFQVNPFVTTGLNGFKVASVAYATALSRVVVIVIDTYVALGTSAGPDVQLADFRPQFEYVKQTVDIDVPSVTEQSATILSFITLTTMVVTFNPEAVAAFGPDSRLTPLVFLPALGLGRATSTIVGQSLGTQKPERIESVVRLATKVGVSVMLVTDVLAYIFAEPIVAFFLQTGTASAAQTIDLGVEYIHIRAVEFGFIGVLQAVLGACRGAGNTKAALGLSLFALWLGHIPIVYLLSFQFSLAETGIWLGMAVRQILGATTATAWFTHGTQKHSVVDADAVGA